MTKITNFVWNPVDDCIISELDGTGTVQAVYTNEPQQYGGVISQRRGTTTSTYHADALGSTRFLTDSSGNVTDTYLNDAWGNSIASTGSTVNPFKWVGKYGYYTDDSTGQVYVRARMYQPAVARWVSVDPLPFFDSLNSYCYSMNSAFQKIDPSGAACEYCGPNVDELLVRELQYASRWFNKHFPPWSSYPSFYTYQYWTRWKHMFAIGPQLDWENVTSETFRDANGKLTFCPSMKCTRTYRICAVCVHDHFIGNIMFGYWARLHGFTDTFANFAANMAQLFGETASHGLDKPWDQAGYELGRILADGGTAANSTYLCRTILQNSTAYNWFVLANQTGNDFSGCEECPEGMEGGVEKWLRENNGGYAPF